MADAVAVQIAQGVVDALNAQTFSMPFTAERQYVPQYHLEDLEALKILVVPRSLAWARASRAATQQHEYAVDVAVIKRLRNSGDPVEALGQTDLLMAFTEEVFEFLEGLQVAGLATQTMTIANAPLWAPEHLRERDQFTSLMTLTFRLYR